MAIDLTTLAERLPDGLRARVSDERDLDRIVEFRNLFATPSQWLSPAAERHRQLTSPQPLLVTLLVEAASGDLVAVGSTSDGGSMRSPDGSWSVSLGVARPWRRRGIGRALLEVLDAHAREHGARRLIASTHAADPDGARFAEASAYQAFHQRIDSYIEVPAFDASRFEDPDVAMGRIGVRLASYGALVSEHAGDLEAFQRAITTSVWPMLREIPSPRPLPETPPPFEQARLFFAGPQIDPATTIIALRDGQVVGITLTEVKENSTAYTNITGVARSERRRGIALAMKLRALRALRERGVKLFGTTNDEQNAAMRGINRRLGYIPEPPTVMYEKRLGESVDGPLAEATGLNSSAGVRRKEGTGR